MSKQFVSFRYMKSLEKAINHTKYVAFREREGDREYGLFSEEKDHVEVKDFIDSLNDKRTVHSDVAKIHTLIFSMSGNEWERGNYEEGDWQKMVRNIMKDWQLEKGFTVDWVASVHLEKGHPHCHVIIKSIMRDSNGIERRLKVDMGQEREWFKTAMKEEKERMVSLRGGMPPLTREEWERIKQMQLNKPKLARGILDSLRFQIHRRMQEEERKRQYARDFDR